MEKTTTSKRLQEILRERGLRQVDLLEMVAPIAKYYGVSINKVYIHNYVSGKILPKQDKLYCIAKALDVSEAWLMGYDVPRARPRRAGDDVDVFSDLAPGEIVTLRAVLSNPNDRERVLNYARKLADLKRADDAASGKED